MNQNIYDNENFFEGYKKIRTNTNSLNNKLEIPALLSLCPNLQGLRVLDMGCGYGENCKKYIEMGAKNVVGIDISNRMLEVAKQQNQDDRITYLHMSMDDISLLDQKFDVVTSSLAIHYIKEFDKLVEGVATLLTVNGYFIFSQEHPFTTATKMKDYWTKDQEGNITHYNLSDYGVEGIRETSWIVNGVIKYHRSFSSLFNALISKGFLIEKVLEPLPDEDLIQKCPQFAKSYHKPDFLLIKAKRR